MTSKPLDVVNQQLSALRSGDLDNGATQEAEFQLVQEEKVWKIQYIHLNQAGGSE